MQFQKKTTRWIALVAVLLLSITIGLSTAASAADSTQTLHTWYIAYGATDSMTNWNTASYGNILNVSGSNDAYFTVSGNTQSSVTIKAGTTSGSGTITIISQKVSTGDKMTTTIPVTVNATGTSSSSSTSNTNTSNSNNVYLNVGGSHALTETYRKVTNLTSSNTAVAQVSAAPFGDYSTLVVSGMGVGSATISFNHTPEGGSITSKSVYVTVSAATTSGSQASLSGTATSSTSSSFSGALNMEAGRSYSLGSTLYYEITSANTLDSSIASVEKTGTVGSMNLKIKALKAGETTMSFSYRLVSNGPVYNSSHKIVVTGTATTTTTTTTPVISSSSSSDDDAYTSDPFSSNSSSESSSEEEGIKFGKRTQAKATVGKPYHLASGLTLNGESITPGELLWVTPDTSILTVNPTTGVFKAKKKGTATLIAVDISGTYVSSIEVVVS